MKTNAFIGRTKLPIDADLVAALGPAKAAWDQFLAELAQRHEAPVHEWKCYSPKLGWALRVVRKKRTIVWLSPSTGCFTVSFIFGRQAMAAACAAKFPLRVVSAIAHAPKYPEGSGVRLVVKSHREIGALLKLAGIKVAN